MSAGLAQSERREFCDLAATLGPDAATLCAGWTIFDLVAHLRLRETDPVGASGILIPAFAQVTARRMQALQRDYDFDQLVDLVRRGPGRFNPLRSPRVDELVNSLEFFVHHEDIRRGGGQIVRPRVLTQQADDWLWNAATTLATRRLRAARSGVLLRRVRAGRPSDEIAAVSTGRLPVTVTGEPGELVLWLYGRGCAAEVTFSGAEAQLTALKRLSLSI